MTNAIVLDNMNFMELTQDEMIAIDGGNIFGDVCKVITATTIGAVVGTAVSPFVTPAGGYIAGVVTAELVNSAWDYLF